LRMRLVACAIATWALLVPCVAGLDDRELRPAFALADSTGSVLPTGAAWTRHLQWGGEYWGARIDAIGQPNPMGHHGIAIGDVNGDGLEDLYVAMGSGLPNKLLIQGPGGTVREGALEAGVAWLDDTKGALFADMDNDGDQDLLLAMGSTILLCRNDGRGKFTRFVRMRAPTPAPFYSLSVADYDLDGDLDIYGCRYVEAGGGVSDGESGPPNHLLRNDGPESFTEVTAKVGLGAENRRFSLAGIWSDYDDDGDPDLYVANEFGRDILYRNDSGKFVEVPADSAGVSVGSWGHGARTVDLNNDGYEDVVDPTWSGDGRAVAAVDWDGDGDLDLWIRSRSGPQLRFLQNNGSAGQHFLALRLEGSTGNRDAIGARVDVLAGDRRLRRELLAGAGYLSQASKWLHFGLGPTDTVDQVVIRWPGGETDEIELPAVDRRYLVRQGAGIVHELPARAVHLAAEPAASPAPDSSAKVLLKEPLLLPPTLRHLIHDGDATERATLVTLWAQDCSPCLEEVAGLAGRYSELYASGLDVVALLMDRPQDVERAQKIFDTISAPFPGRSAAGDPSEVVQVLLEHLLRQPGGLSLPTSLLVDPHGTLQMIYLGPLDVDGLSEDLERWTRTPVPGAQRSLYPGRWYFRTPRDLLGLATALKERGLRDDARFYLGLAHIEQRRVPASN